MRGARHYAEAERLLEIAEATHWEGPTANVEFAQTAIAEAQVHATLALAAATVEAHDASEGVRDGERYGARLERWREEWTGDGESRDVPASPWAEAFGPPA